MERSIEFSEREFLSRRYLLQKIKELNENDVAEKILLNFFEENIR